MFASWGSLMSRYRWAVLGGVLIAVLACGTWGIGVFGQLTEGGYGDRGSESARAARAIERGLGPRGGDVVLVYGVGTGTVDDPGVGDQVTAALAALPADAVLSASSYWQSRAPQLVNAGHTKAVATLTLAGADDGTKLAAYREIKDDLAVPGLDLQTAGAIALQDVTADVTTSDLATAELVSMPIVLALLLIIFGSLVAASLPVLVGACSVLGALGVLRAVALGTEVNSFAVNVASLLGLGMAIDYGLFMVGRFREEQAAGLPTPEAVSRTVATAGRTVAFSATLLTTALAGLLLFPQVFLRSLAYGGMAAVALAALTSLTLLPALLAVLGPRVDRLPVRLGRRRRNGTDQEGTFWARLARAVMRRPAVVVLPVVALLALLAVPVAGVQFGEEDERVLPAGNPARQAVEALKADFPALGTVAVDVVLRGASGTAPSATTGRAFTEQISRVPGVRAVEPAGAGGDVYVLTVAPADPDPFSTEAADTVEAIRALTPPGGTTLLVGGTTARNVDNLDATVDRLPWMIGLMVGATIILMFLAFGSVLLPLKAVLLSAVSLSATFGVLVWVFQQGHGAALLNVTPAPPGVGIVVLMAAVVFGLSTDYEVFLMSRMVEARAGGASTEQAVTAGLVRTGRVITAAALLLIVVTGVFAMSSLTTMRFIGVGMIIALLLDATVVRMLLAPAILRLLGDASWWAPAALRRLQERAGLSEVEAPSQGVTVAEAAPPGDAPGADYSTWPAHHAGPIPPAPVAPPPPVGEVDAAPVVPTTTAGAAGVAAAPAAAEPHSSHQPRHAAWTIDEGDEDGGRYSSDPRVEGAQEAAAARRAGVPRDLAAERPGAARPAGHGTDRDRPGPPPTGERRSAPRHSADRAH